MYLNGYLPQITSTNEDTNRRGTQANAVVRPTQAETRRARHNQQAQQGTEAGNGNKQHRNGGSHIVVEEKDCFGLALGVLMTGFEGMRVHNNNTVHHMRVSEQCDSSPIRQEQQGKKEFHDAA